VVTGAASGIGASLARALSAAGAYVVCADVDLPGAEAVAATCGGRAVARRVDVTDAAAVQTCVEEVVERHGRLDLMVNNAGITFAGRTEELSLAQWDALVDVNIRGVVHGVHAAYPVMLRQGAGHIVNTASMAGLAPSGLLTAYATTKHAVVGLSLALRTEARPQGVGVTVVCPAAVETPILDSGEVGGFDGRRYYLSGQGIAEALDPDVLARQTLRAVRRDRAMLVSPARARATWTLSRWAPGLFHRTTTGYVQQQMAQMS